MWPAPAPRSAQCSLPFDACGWRLPALHLLDGWRLRRRARPCLGDTQGCFHPGPALTPPPRPCPPFPPACPRRPNRLLQMPQPRPAPPRRLWVALVLILVWGANFSVQKAVFNVHCRRGAFLFVRYLVMPLAAALLLCSRYGTGLAAPAARGPAGLAAASWGIDRASACTSAWSPTASTGRPPFSSALILACGPVFTLADPALVRAGAPDARAGRWCRRWPSCRRAGVPVRQARRRPVARRAAAIWCC